MRDMTAARVRSAREVRTTTRRGRPVGTVVLRPVEMLACWDALDLTDPPFLLQLRIPTHDHRERTARDFRTALTALERRGLTDGRQALPPLTTMLRTLANPDHQLDIRFTGPGGRPVVGLGAVRAAHGVAAVISGGDGAVELREMDGTRVAPWLLGLLGTTRAGIAPCVNLPVEVFDRAASAAQDGSPWAFADELIARGVPRRDATATARMLTGITFGGQLGVTMRRRGYEHRGPWVVGFVRNGAGESFVQFRRGDTVTIGPADADRLLRHWAELLDHSATVASR